MPPAPLTLHLPQPCPESWDAMAPTHAGRHCAACQKTVVDFTRQTDAEVLAYFQRATGREVCGRLRPDQLNRPLLPAPAGANSTSRWRAWLALALAAWGAGRVEAAATPPPHPVHRTQPPAAARHRSRPLAARYVQGTVLDSATRAPLAGVAVFLRGESRQTTTDANGWFGLRLSARRPRGGRALVLHYAGYHSETRHLPGSRRPVTRLALVLRPDAAAAGAEVVGYQSARREWYTSGAVSSVVALETVRLRKPWPWHPRAFYYWATQPFRRQNPGL